ncbi:granzyme-like protein 1 [Centropristis striata]|uniref:granzyme-like protein 1 n=1 Tax=Centropristis striata TaxID=184440 RepID=UPI0027DEF7D7|nr:granzyme-like protein 1 [Centropristis striata]
MSIQCELVILILVLTLNGQVHTGEIIGGHETTSHSRPYMVLLEKHLEDNKTAHCGGFLLNEDFVMTAAHCKAKSYNVILGAHNVHNEDKKVEQRKSVEISIPHEEYNASDYHYKNDIMLLKLSSKANYSEYVKPITLADQADGSLPKICHVSGWGRTDKNSIYMSPKLMEVKVTLVEQCEGEHLYCNQGDKGPAQGDSGGPLVCEDGKAYGVVSASYPNADGQETYTYSKIPYYRNWIDSKMKEHGTHLHM